MQFAADAKGKIERRHDYWQKRLPPLLAADQIFELCGANHLLDQLVPHANAHEIHRELGIAPQAARDQALAEKRSVLRPVPACPWWPFVWSQRTRVRVGDDGKVPVGAQRHALDMPPRTTVIRCLRPDGDIYYSVTLPIRKPCPWCSCTAQSSENPSLFLLARKSLLLKVTRQIPESSLT